MCDRKQKSGKKERQRTAIRADGRRAKNEMGEAPVFRGGWKNICIHPRPSSPPPHSYRPRDSSISAPASPYSKVSPAEATFAPSLCFFLSAFNPLSPSPPLSFISARTSVFLSSSSCFSLLLFSFLLPRGRFSSSLFSSSAQCASENMNPSSHCLRQRFSNFLPLCANDEGTKGEIKSRSQ